MDDRDIFYETAKLSRPEQEIVLRKAHSICERWWFDKLDCLESFARQHVKGISFEDAMGHFVEGALMNVIHRRQILPLDEPHLKVGFRSMELTCGLLPLDYRPTKACRRNRYRNAPTVVMGPLEKPKGDLRDIL